MPCSDNWSCADEERHEKDTNKKKYGRAISDIALLGEVACQACTILEQLGYDFNKAPELIGKWWPQHKKQDKERKDREAKDKLREKIEKEHAASLKKALKEAGLK